MLLGIVPGSIFIMSAFLIQVQSRRLLFAAGYAGSYLRPVTPNALRSYHAGMILGIVSAGSVSSQN